MHEDAISTLPANAAMRPATSWQVTSIDARNLERYCFKADDQLLVDLTAVLAAVRSVDRSEIRQHSIGWRRELSIDVAVARLDLWRRPEVLAALLDALNYLTADNWSANFVKRHKRKPGPSQTHLVSLPPQARVFMPYSNGLDSYAIATELRDAPESPELILVNVNSKARLTAWQNLTRGKQIPMVQVACYAQDPHHAEPTFRSRAFLYGLLAGYGAASAQPAQVVIPENGQGSLGPSLVPLGSEAPHRSCHPGFTARLARLLKALTGVDVQFIHPALFRTKGEVLGALARHNSNIGDWLLAHRSCSYDQRYASNLKRLMHCGVCGNCLLRRTSLVWNELDDPTEYRARHCGASTFAAAFDGAVPRNIKAMRDLAFNGVRSMQRLANVADDPWQLRVLAEISAVARGLGEPVHNVGDKMRQFLAQHQAEWARFLKSCGPASWVADFAGH